MISVIVPCLGHAAELRDCLAALGSQKGSVEYEVIVVDSGHDPEVVEAVEGCPLARVVRGDHGLGPGVGRNLGVEHANGATLVFTDADCIPDEGFLEAAQRAVDSGIRMATGPVLDADARWLPACDNLLQFVDFAPTRPAGPAQLAPGCNLVIRREDFLELGGFGEGGGEDVRFITQSAATSLGGPVFRPDLRVSHQGRTTWREFLDHQRGFGYSRGFYGLLLEPWQRRLGAYAVMIPPVALKRYLYLLRRTLEWSPRRLGFVLFYAPVLMAGQISWAIGFQKGLRDG